MYSASVELSRPMLTNIDGSPSILEQLTVSKQYYQKFKQLSKCNLFHTFTIDQKIIWQITIQLYLQVL